MVLPLLQLTNTNHKLEIEIDHQRTQIDLICYYQTLNTKTRSVNLQGLTKINCCTQQKMERLL